MTTYIWIVPAIIIILLVLELLAQLIVKWVVNTWVRKKTLGKPRKGV